MRMSDIILKKRQGGRLETSEIEYFVKGCVSGAIPDYQISALLMAIFFSGLDQRETTDLTMFMYKSGDTIDLSGLPGIKVDKHSTGGVGDKTTLILAPLVASAGVTVAKMSGRGLGHTGGTIDKLESIPGFKAELDHGSFIQQVRDIGLAVVTQTGNLVPADKKLYALRDVTATVDNISLIASSVMSKKLASGADAIVLDVKTGRGAFMKNPEEAWELARLMVDIGGNLGRKTVALITPMDQPLGQAVGNALEIRESIDTLRNKGPGDLKKICLYLGAEMLVLAGKAGSNNEAMEILENNLEMIAAQGGNTDIIENTGLLPKASGEAVITAWENGYLTEVDAMGIGLSAMNLGAGRENKESPIDLGAGLILHRKTGDRVTRGEPLVTLYYNSPSRVEKSVLLAKQSFKIGETPPQVFKDSFKRIG